MSWIVTKKKICRSGYRTLIERQWRDSESENTVPPWDYIVIENPAFSLLKSGTLKRWERPAGAATALNRYFILLPTTAKSFSITYTQSLLLLINRPSHPCLIAILDSQLFHFTDHTLSPERLWLRVRQPLGSTFASLNRAPMRLPPHPWVRAWGGICFGFLGRAPTYWPFATWNTLRLHHHEIWLRVKR